MPNGRLENHGVPHRFHKATIRACFTTLLGAK